MDESMTAIQTSAQGVEACPDGKLVSALYSSDSVTISELNLSAGLLDRVNFKETTSDCK